MTKQYYKARIYEATSPSEVEYLNECAWHDRDLTDRDRIEIMDLADWMIGEMMP